MDPPEKTIYNALPKLPGFSFEMLQQPELAMRTRPQLCTINAKGARMVKDGGMALARNAQAATGRGGGAAGSGRERTASQAAREDDDAAGCGIPTEAILERFPQWRSLDDKVLRFFGYYAEDVVDSTLEKWRVRKVKVHYFLADGTASVVETPSEANSGLQRGTIVLRYKPEDVDVFQLCLGAAVELRGLTIYLVDCDAATREFCEVMGMPQPDPLEYPGDDFAARSTRVARGVDEEHAEMRRVVELQAATRAGTHASLLTPAERVLARDFYTHDRDALRFYASWAKQRFRILYHLADDTVAVLFDKAPNDGRDACPAFVRRSRIPKDAKAVLLSLESLRRPHGAPTEFLTAMDLRTNTYVDIFTRPFFIYDCDPHTRAYMESLGIPQPAVPAPPCEADEITAGRRPPRRAQQSLQAREDKAAAKAAEEAEAERLALKKTRFAQDVFRFSAVQMNPGPGNEGRRFMVCFYLANDTVSVYELPQNNNGHAGGKIFARRAVSTVADPSTLHVGGTVRLDGVDYVLQDMDERTRRYVEMGMPNMPEKYFRVQEILVAVGRHLHQNFSGTTDAFRHYASSATEGLNHDNVQELLTDAETGATEQEVEDVWQRVDADGDGRVSLAEFTEQFLQHPFISTFKPKAALSTFGDTRGTATVRRGPIQSAEFVTAANDAQATAEIALRQFLTLLEARRTLAIRSFRNVAASTYDGNLGVAEFEECVKTRLQAPMTDEEISALLYKFYYVPGLQNWKARRLPVQEIQRILRL